MSANEMALGADVDPNLTPEERRHAGLVNAYQKRWDSIQSLRSELYPELLEAEVHWGTSITDLMKPLFQIQNELFFAIHDYLETQDPNVREDMKEHLLTASEQQKRRAIMYARYGHGDDYERQFRKGIERVEQALKPYLRK